MTSSPWDHLAIASISAAATSSEDPKKTRRSSRHRPERRDPLGRRIGGRALAEIRWLRGDGCGVAVASGFVRRGRVDFGGVSTENLRDGNHVFLASFDAGGTPRSRAPS